MKLLWISPLSSFPAANRDRDWQTSFANMLMSDGHEIFFIYCGPESDSDSLRKMKRLFTRFLFVPAYSPNGARHIDLERLKTAVKLFAGEYEYLVCSFWLLAPVLAAAPTEIVKILIPFLGENSIGHDFFFYKQQEFLQTTKESASFICEANIIVAREEDEKKFLKKYGVAAPVYVCNKREQPDREESGAQGICSALKYKNKRVLIVIDYPFWMVRHGGHAPGFIVMANYLRQRYTLDIFFHGYFKEWEREQAAKLGLGNKIYSADDYQDPDRQVVEPGEQDYLPAPLLHHYKRYHYNAFANFLANRPKYDAIIVFTIFNSWLIKALPYDTLTILDTHDFWSLRNYIYNGTEDTLLSASQEIGVFSRYDATIFVEASETLHARRLMPHAISICCPFTYPELPLPFPASGLHFGFIAPLHIVDPIKWFIDEVWALQDCADARLHIFGTVCEAIKRPPSNVILHGVVQSERKIHSYCNIMLNPAFIATGISTKTVMSLAYGRPVLATSVGARGVAKATGHGIYVANSRAEFIQGMQLFSHDRGMLEKFSRDGLEFSQQVFNVNNAYEPLANLIESY